MAWDKAGDYQGSARLGDCSTVLRKKCKRGTHIPPFSTNSYNFLNYRVSLFTIYYSMSRREVYTCLEAGRASTFHTKQTQWFVFQGGMTSQSTERAHTIPYDDRQRLRHYSSHQAPYGCHCCTTRLLPRTHWRTLEMNSVCVSAHSGTVSHVFASAPSRSVWLGVVLHSAFHR